MNGPPEIQLGDPEIVSLQQFREDAARLVERVNEEQVSIAVTRHGEFLALIIPLTGAGLMHLDIDEKMREDFTSRLYDASHSGIVSRKELEALERRLREGK